MARSKIKGTKGKPVKKAKNRDQLKSSINIYQFKGTPGDGKVKHHTSITQKNDGRNEVNYKHEGPKGTTRTKVKGVEAARKPLKGQGYGARETKYDYKKSNYEAKKKQFKKFKNDHGNYETKFRKK